MDHVMTLQDNLDLEIACIEVELRESLIKNSYEDVYVGEIKLCVEEIVRTRIFQSIRSVVVDKQDPKEIQRMAEAAIVDLSEIIERVQSHRNEIDEAIANEEWEEACDRKENLRC